MKKRFQCCAAIAAMALVMAVPSLKKAEEPQLTVVEKAFVPVGYGPGSGEWVQDEYGWKYRYGDDDYSCHKWEKINGKWYYFHGNGYMATGFIEWNGKWYYLDEQNGDMAVSEKRVINGITYEFNADGEANAAWPYKAITEITPENQKSELEKTVDEMCDQVLAGIVNDGMSKRQKAEAIYAWVRGSFRYSGHSATRDWVQEAYQGLRSHHGDCYTYFAVSQALLTRVGINCIEVIRCTDNDHYWELVQLEDGWWHFDTTPRSAGGYFCLWSDAQMLGYSANHRGCFAFDQAIYPKTPQ